MVGLWTSDCPPLDSWLLTVAMALTVRGVGTERSVRMCSSRTNGDKGGVRGGGGGGGGGAESRVGYNVAPPPRHKRVN